ncbi:hypothetical protein GQ53DRAFT_466759 [Thozetella sp. PMI_491]|nr:hypothetical protein GQ53DRAFT_466759 [Thozetella sp. PMI_491]
MSDAAAGPAGLPTLAKLRNRRTRTGCERCRLQHRKCDEGKPRCRRCTVAGADCKYLAHISFLDKNSRTVSNDHASTATSELETVEYSTLEFIEDRSSHSRETPSISASASQVTGSVIRLLDREETPGAIPSASPTARNSDTRHHIIGDQSHLSQRNKSGSLEAVELEKSEELNRQVLSSILRQRSSTCEGDFSWALYGRCSLSGDETGLLTYFIQHVTPWLDVYDQLQTFRHLVSQLAFTSPCVMEGLLELSANCSGRSTDLVQRRGAGLLHLRAMSLPLSDNSPSSSLRLIAGFVFTRTHYLVQEVPGTWQLSFQKGGVFPGFNDVTSKDAAERRMWFAFVALIARLELACSLMCETAPVMISKLLRQISTPLETREASLDQPRAILNASLSCLGLLADVMTLCYSQSDIGIESPLPQDAAPTSGSESRPSHWKRLLGELSTWHTNRPPELQCLMETESPDASFPTVICAGGAAISCNSLYHAAMMLLLSNRPQSISLAEDWVGKPKLEAVRMSPIWHARRLCGILLHSDPEQSKCWDPCMIAACWFVARRLTHMSQQEDILACLGRVKAAGWHIDGLVQKLRQEWGLTG